jgi:hypothetical protein
MRGGVAKSEVALPAMSFQSRLRQILSSNSLSCSRSIGSPDLQSTATQHRCLRGSSTISTFRIYSPVMSQTENHPVHRRKFLITASSNSPISGLPCRENATAPPCGSFLESASARRIAAAA